jgi:hypothetical protein
MNKLLVAMAVTVAGSATFACQASAEELWDPYLRGVNEGLAAGALPPQGVYFVLDNYLANYNYYNNSANKVPNGNVNALVEVPILLWSTGIQILGADFAVAIAQPFDYTSAGRALGSNGGQGNWGTYNTIIVPGQLAWTLGEFHIKAGLEIYLDDASSTVNSRSAHGGLPSGNAYTAVQPDLAFSWLHDGWNLSADFHVAIPVTANSSHPIGGGAVGNYWSGNEFSADYTIAKTFDKWTFGVGIHQENQFTSDTLNGVTLRHSSNTNFGAGPLVGYQFGGVGVVAEYNHNIYTRNDVAGDIFNIRLVIPL